MEKIFSPIYRHNIHSFGFKFNGDFKRCNSFIYRKSFYTINLFHDLGSVYRSVAFTPSKKEINMNDHTFMLKFNDEYVKFMDVMGMMTSDKKGKLLDLLYKHMKDNRQPNSPLDDEETKNYIVNILKSIRGDYDKESHIGAFFTPKCFIMGQYIEEHTGNVYPVYYVLNNYFQITEWLKKEVTLLGQEILEIDNENKIIVTNNISTLQMSDAYTKNIDKWLVNFNNISILESREKASEKEKEAYIFIMKSFVDMFKIKSNNRMEIHHA